jgi:hypothetical protein
MADTQQAPQMLEPLLPDQGSIDSAQEALLGLMESEEETPETLEAEPVEESESTEEIQDNLAETEEEDVDESSEEEFEEESQEEEEPLYSVRVNGEEQEVNLDELVKGYSRQSDYTKKTQELAEQRKQFEDGSVKYKAELDQIQHERQQYLSVLSGYIEKNSGLEKFSNINWEELRDFDPMEYVSKREEFREAKEKIQEAKGQYEEAQKKQESSHRQSYQEALHKEHASMVEKMPDWGVPEKQSKIAQNLRTYAESQGFSTEELNSLIDHRSLLVLTKSMEYDKLKSSNPKAKKIKNAPRVARSGKGTAKSSNDRAKRAAQMKRLRETGHVDDSVRLFEDFVEL